MKRPVLYQTVQEIRFVKPDLEKCFAKTFFKNNKKTLGRTVFDHCEIVGLIAENLVLNFPEWVRKIFFPSGVHLISAAHDVGKISPAFQKKIYQAAGLSHNNFIGIEFIDIENEKNWGWHQGVSLLSAESYNLGQVASRIIGRHHGTLPNTKQNLFNDGDQELGGEPWKKARHSLLEDLKNKFNCDWPAKDQKYFESIISGLTVVSDWLGSAKEFDDPTVPISKNYIQEYLNKIGFTKTILKKNLSFENIFGFRPLEAQQILIDNCKKPGIYILEAPMGYGKTEAALFAAYQMLTNELATGVYFALPTQLTSDVMYERMQKFLDKICEEKGTAKLIHRNSWLYEFETGGQFAPEKSWFDGTKKGILAQFAVGTLDQALLAVLNVKYNFVRAFGLVGKVVIIDEAHSYDFYTGTLLDELLKELEKWKCTVIILSATLTRNRREKLLSYSSHSSGYPLISGKVEDCLIEKTFEISEEAEIQTRIICNQNIAIEEVLNRASLGQQVVWIENNVAKAQEIYKVLGARCSEINITCGILHSRFLKCDRKSLENEWVPILGKNGHSIRGNRGRILVGTQILEQSLDIDVDFFVTRLCPSDMLLQRMGRLWRHKDTKRPSSARREFWILACNESDENDFTKVVYSPYVLYRTQEVWSQLSSVFLPSQVRSIMESTYEIREETGHLLNLKQDLEHRKRKLRSLALVNTSEQYAAESDKAVETRYSEIDQVQTLLVKKWNFSGGNLSITFLNGKTIELSNSLYQDKRVIAQQLNLNTLNVSLAHSIKLVGKQNTQIALLGNFIYLDEEPFVLRIGIVQADGRILSIDGEKQKAIYDLKMGYIYDRK
jgi:CRISPR-associated endonuclease/helicase Cas3